jgi:hypothetical protein
VDPCGPAVALPAKPRPGRDLSLPHLIGGEGALRQARVAEADLDFDGAVATNARTDSERQATECDLKIRNLQPFRSHGDFAIGSEPRGLEIGTERDLGAGGRDYRSRRGSYSLIQSKIESCN